MPEKIRWNLQVRVAGGPQVVSSGSMDVEAYDKLTIEVDAGADKEAKLVPTGGGPVSLVLIVPAVPSATLSYEVDGTAVALDAPHAYLGTGAATLLGADLSSLTFSNNGTSPAAIDILFGRDATP